MNKPKDINILFLVVALLFSVLTIFSIADFFTGRKDINHAIPEWDKGLRTFINDFKSASEIVEYDENIITIKRFVNPPRLNSSEPSAYINSVEIEYSIRQNELIRREGNNIEHILSDLSEFNLTIVNNNLESTENINQACGFSVFAIFKKSEKKVPVEFTFFSEYLYTKVVHKDFFDLIDSRDF
ncbi:MAG: hypothetical protein ACQESP_08925 [Candidatus Muiribacteriota bacterium]